MNRLPLFEGETNNDLDSRVIGGEDAADSSAPYIASIRRFLFEGLTETMHICGGTILTQKWILTAAHCTFRVPTHTVQVMVGTNKRTSGGNSYDVNSIVTHEDYNANTLKNDISLLKIVGSIKFDTNIQPIKLPTSDIGAGAMCTLKGWGKTDSQVAPENLQVVYNLTTIYVEECNRRLDNVSKKFLPIIDKQLCTLNKERKGTCKGDSGGPLISGGVQVGIVSWGVPCAKGKPDVYTRVYCYVKWINNYISN
ncbi:chymotrypsin-1-like [Pieris rapae]|uniref:chymotrypsin-1-like n=1 Tax=Pieris rapae TaxID=64459 RepID=UPI001E280265|nr:chymotrypsin-1-like [Pieris rapae]